MPYIINPQFRCIISGKEPENEPSGLDRFLALPQARCVGVSLEDPVKLYLLCLDCDLLHLHGDRSLFAWISSRLTQRFEEDTVRQSSMEDGCASIRSMLELLSIGDPDARVSLPIDIDEFRLLEPLLNQMADFMKQQIEDSHEAAIGLCEHYETLLQIAAGNLEKRANTNSPIELIAKLGELINSQADTFLNVIKQRKHAEDALKKAHDSLEHTVEERTAELRAAKEVAETANKAKSTFLSNMSHELRTPLNAILGYAQLMQRDPSIQPKHREYLDTVNRSGEHLLGLINHILEMSRIEAQNVTTEPVTSFDNYHGGGNTGEESRKAAPELTPVLLRTSLSVQMLKGLRTAVLALDTKRTLEILDSVAMQNPSIGTTLMGLALNLDYDRLLSLLEEDTAEVEKQG